jgi:hypothetical protein
MRSLTWTHKEPQQFMHASEHMTAPGMHGAGSPGPSMGRLGVFSVEVGASDRVVGKTSPSKRALNNWHPSHGHIPTATVT